MWCRLAVGPRRPPCAGGGGWWWRGAWGRVGSAGSVLVGRVLVVGLGMGALLLWADGRAVGFTSNTRGPPLGGAAASSLGGGRGPPLGCCRLLFWGGVLGSALPPGPGRVLGLWWLWWVVCDLYSGCEHLCCLRAPPFFFVSSCVRRGACGGGVWPAGPPFCGGGRGRVFVVCGFVGHSVDALAPRADEGRCGLRYAPGSWRASFDPGVSEWGNPARVVLGHHHLNVYRVVGGTRGSETSQYP